MGKIIVIGSAVQRQRTALGGQLQMRKKRDLVPFMDNNSVWTVNDRKKAKQEIKRAIETEKEARLRIHRSIKWTDACRAGRRQKVLLDEMCRIKDAYADIKLPFMEQYVLSYETKSYEHYEDLLGDGFLFAAAIYVLDSIDNAGNKGCIMQYLRSGPQTLKDHKAFFSDEIYHPRYDNDLILRVCKVLSGYDDPSEDFLGLLSQMDPEDIETAVELFRKTKEDAFRRFLKCKSYLHRRAERAEKEAERHLNNTIKATMTLAGLVPGAGSKIKPEITLLDDFAKKKKIEDAKGLCFRVDDSYNFDYIFEEIVMKSPPGYRDFDRTYKEMQNDRKIQEILEGFTIKNPFALCFAAVYLISRDEDEVYLLRKSNSVLCMATTCLPWMNTHNDNEDIEDRDGEETETHIENKMQKEEYPPLLSANEMYGSARGEINFAQTIFSKTGCIMPENTLYSRGIWEALYKGEDEKEKEKLKNTLIFCDAILTASSRLHFVDPADSDKEKEPEEISQKVHEPAEETGDIQLPDSDEETSAMEEISAPEEIINSLKEEILLLKKENKSLKSTVAEQSKKLRDAEEEKEKEERRINMERRELADLREKVFSMDSENGNGNDAEEDLCEGIDFPYDVHKKMVVFGGHPTFINPLKKMLPGMVYIKPENMKFSSDVIKNADIVWVQSNCISHPQYWNVIKYCKQFEKPLRYFVSASAKKAALQAVTEDMGKGA